MELPALIRRRLIRVGALVEPKAAMTTRVTRDGLGTHLRGRFYLGFFSAWGVCSSYLSISSAGSIISLVSKSEREMLEEVVKDQQGAPTDRPGREPPSTG